MGEKENNNNQNRSPVTRWLRNAVLGATMADQPAMMTASGWRQNEKGDYVQDQQNDPHVIQLRDNLAAEGAGVMLGEFGIPAVYGLYNLGVRGLGRAGNNWARAKLISREMQNVATPNHTYPLNVGWGPKQTIKVTHATDSQEPLQLFFDKRWDVTHEGANPFGVWYQGKWGQPRTAATNSLPGKAEKAAKAREVFENRKYKHEGEVTLDKPLTTVGEVPNRSVLSYDAEKIGADGIIYNNVYDNGYDNNQVILSYKLHVPLNKKGSKIHIKKKNRGKFTEYCGGEVTDKCIQKAKKSGNSKLVKRAVFAQNARGWSKKHKEGGEINNKDIDKSPDKKPKKKLVVKRQVNPTGMVNKRPIPGLLTNELVAQNTKKSETKK